MKIFKTVSVKKEEIDEVICNMCGDKIEKDATGNFADYLQVYKKWGYYSNHDGEEHSFDLCEKCYNNMVNKFKIPAE